MHANTVETETSLRLVRRYSAPPALVFEALTDPSMLSTWFAPSDEFEIYVDRFEAVVGSTFRIEMRHEGGNVHTCVGTIQELKQNERLVYTWSWEGGEMGQTLVTWELNETDDGTELVLLHDRFPNDEAKSQHQQGWTAMMERLAGILA